MPFEVGSSASFHNMIHSLNKTISIPDKKELLFILDSKKNEIVKSLCSVLSGKYFSVTTDHWTSLAVDNYAAFTIHFIANFELKSYVLCCSKHDDESTALKLEHQLFNALAQVLAPFKEAQKSLKSEKYVNLSFPSSSMSCA